MNQRPTYSRPARPELFLILGSGLTVTLIIVIIAVLLIREHASALQAAKRSASNITQLINADVLRNVELYDLALQGLIAATSRKDLAQVSADIRHLVLFDQSTAAPFKGEILLLDKSGAVTADSSMLTPTPRNFANHDYFQIHQQSTDAGLFISRPFKVPCDCEQVWRIAFSRRVQGVNGEFSGVAVATMRLAYFDQLFSSLTIGSGSTINLLNSNGILLAQQPLMERDMIDKDLSSRSNFKRMLREGSGSFSGVSSLDGTPRLYTFTNVGRLPLIVVVALSSEDVFAAWKRAALLVSGATGVLCVGLLWLTWMLRLELRRRYRAEKVLSELAATDALTSLANRRTLDQRLRMEWDRTQRSGEPLALLMIDIDHFKSFNDRHGHQGGDEALRNVAQAIASSVRRPADLATRYGGEEFAVILPHTDSNGAGVIAEYIRSAVEHLPRVAGDTLPITVSIGISVADKNSHGSLEELLLCADRALYEAKHTGRNRIVDAQGL
ncbi:MULTISPECIES: sensor domain-containing diguanylate cyclase [unclassified Pseudomonas]|uniref:sensor domain-containing diguanylate cyclase n=1 Tax=unclassified Pseudomonas TaxID=196821 RepID=UPI0011EE5D1F|nr:MULTISPECIES: sensor domain-containing diguanylate cyclase [unclassified Pseudomonas]KAA0949676.1 GGDEF domain-containing protein [Pseudomonas sp. ANT_H4]KAA0954556.1 GGDEF domain-containing protein [Pseudomonas sp. ANT_H14]